MTLHRLLASSAIVQGVGLILTMLLGVQLARYLGPTDYGIYGLIMAVVSIAAVVGQFGMPLLATREAARPGVDLGSLARWLFPRSALMCALVALAVVAGTLLAGPQGVVAHHLAIYLAGAFTALSAFLAVAVGLLRGAGANMTGQTIDLLLRPAIIVALVFLLNLLAPIGVETVLAIQLAVVLFSLLLVTGAIVRVRRMATPAERGFALAGWFATSSTYLANALLGALNASYPMIVAGLFVSGPDLGILRVALASVAFLGLPSAIANIAAIPLVAREHASRDREALARTISHTTIAGFLLTAAGWLFLLVFGRPAIILLFGAVYESAYGPLLILGIAQLVIAAFGIAGSYFNLSGRERLVTRAFLIAVPTAILASFPLTLMFGIMGSAAAAVTMAVLWHFYAFVVRRDEVDVPLSLVAAFRHVWSQRGTAH